MKSIKYKITAAIMATAIFFGGCRGHQEASPSLSYTNFETSYINASPSGELTVRAWGSGPDKARAIEEAMKNAVSDVIFKGVKGLNSYSGQPIVTEVNARERYADYFDRFFATGGEYRKFVREASSSDKSRVRSKSTARENYGVTVCIDRNALRRQLREDGVIK